MNPYSEFTCLYTSQKQKKAKTWHDGHVRYFHNNSKVVLYDSKYAVLDSTFKKGTAVAIGDDLDMDRHLITVEEFTSTVVGNADQTSANTTASAARAKSAFVARNPQPTVLPRAVPAASFKPHIQLDLKRKKWKAPFANTNSAQQEQVADSIPNDPLDGVPFDFSEHDLEEMDDFARPSNSLSNNTHIPTQPPTSVVGRPNQPLHVPKRRKVGLSRGSVPLSSGTQPAILSSHRTPSTQLEFPNAARCTNFVGKNSGPRRTISLGTRFSSMGQYKDGMSYLIYDHLQVMVIEIAIALWSIKTSPAKDGDAIDSFYRSRNIHMHSQATLRRRGDPYAGFPMFSGKGASGSGDPSAGTSAPAVAGAQQGAVLTLCNKEHHSKYSKDDLWVISRTSKFDAASTFFARSVFYGPSGNDVEISCLSSKDSNVARELFANSTSVCAIRLLNAMSEFMMLDNLTNELTNTPLLPVILNYIPPELVKTSKTAIFKAPTRIPEKTGCIVLTEDDGINVEMEVLDTIDRFNLNMEQASVLRNFALTVIRAPGWGSKSQEPPPILLVHGVFGAGKSFLIAVLIIFADTIISKARPVPREERSCRFLVASMTNVAVDRILTALLDLGYTDFVRVGSLKKVARRILPYTAQSGSRPDEDIKELQAELRDDNLPARERHCIKKTIQLFQKGANRDIIEGATVVGATCIASTFEALDSMAFPIVILDEASQLLEPMSLVPLCRAAGEKLIMVGDPLQLAPPVTTKVDTASANSGYTRTLFDRAVEMGVKPIMLKTQYRCHPRIAELSSSLFYSNELKAGMTPQDRAPLVEGLPTLAFIDNDGSEIQNPRSKSFTNPAETRLVVEIVQRLLSLNIPGSDIGVISLYKSQAEAIQASLDELTKVSNLKGGSVQISTVDAFQGSEKDVIIVSTVRTESVGFIDNRQRVNVALSRSKRHLFLVGNSKLLTTNRLWDQIINTHCAGAQDGLIRAEQFAKRLRTLEPLPKPPVTQTLEASDSEDDEEPPQARQSQSSDPEKWHDSADEASADEADPNHSPRTGPRRYAAYQDDSESERSDDNEYDSRKGMLKRSGTTNARDSVRKPIRATSPLSDANMSDLSRDGRYPALLPPKKPLVPSTSARAHQDQDLSRPHHVVQSIPRQEMEPESQPRFGNKGQISRPAQLSVPEITPAPISVAQVQNERVEPEELVWEVTEEDYMEYDTVQGQHEVIHKEFIGIDTPDGTPHSHPPVPTLPRIDPPETLDEIDVIDYCESQRLEDLEGSWSLTQPTAIRSSSHTANLPLDPPPTDRERHHEAKDFCQDDEQDLALLEMDIF